MASRDLVVAVFAEGAQFREFMEQGGPRATKTFAYAVDDMAKKQIAAMTATQTKLRELQAEYAKVAASSKAGSAEFAAANSLLMKTNRQLGLSTQTMGQTLDSISRKAMGLGKTLSTYITLPMAAVAAYSAKAFIDFQRNMEMIHTQAGAPQPEVTRQTPAILNLAQTSSPLGPNDLAKGMYYLESVGIRGSKAMAALKTSSDAAGMGIANLEDVTKGLAGVIVTGIKGFKTYDQAMGIVNATVGNGAMHMQDYADALRTAVVPSAKTAGVTLQQVGAALDVLTDRGMGAQSAATRLRMTISMMQSPTKAAVKALEQLGISHYQLANDLNSPGGLLKALLLLQAAIDKSSNKTQAYDLVLQAFGKGRSSAGILSLLNSLTSSTSSFQGKLATITEQEHQFAEAVAAYHQTAAYKISHAWASVQASLIKLGGVLAPSLTVIAGAVSNVVKWFDKLPPSVQKIAGVSAIVATALGPVLLIGGVLIKSFLQFTGIIAGIGKIFATQSAVADGALSTVAASETAVGTAATAAGAAVTESTAVQVAGWESVGGAMVPVITEENAIGDAAVINAAKVDAFKGSLLSLGGRGVLGALGAVGAAIAAAYAAGQIDQNGGYNANAAAILGHKTHVGKEGMTVAVNKNESITFGRDGKISLNSQHGAIGGSNEITLAQAAKDLGVSVTKLKDALNGGKPANTNPVSSVFIPRRGAGNMSAGKAKMIAFAQQALGNPYVWGGNAPGGFDCSGLVEWAFANGLNVSIPHSTYSQVTMGTETAYGYGNTTSGGQLHPGDVIFTNYGEKGRKGPGHEGLVVGFDSKGNPIIESAPHPGTVVQNTSLAGFAGNGYWTARDIMGKGDGSGTPGSRNGTPKAQTWQQLLKKYGIDPNSINPTNPNAAAEAKKKLAEARKAGNAAAKAILDPIETTQKALAADTSAAKKADPTAFGKIINDIKKQVKATTDAIASVRFKMGTNNQFEKAKLQTELNKLLNEKKAQAASLTREINEQGTALARSIAKGMVAQYTSYESKYKAVQTLEQYQNIPGVKTNFVDVLSGMVSKEVKTVSAEITKIKNKIATASGAEKTTLQSTLTKLNDEKNNLTSEIEQSLQDKISAMQTAYDTAKSNFSQAYGALSNEVTSMFQEQTQSYIDNIIAKQYYQQTGQLTPEEQALKDFQNKLSSQQMQRAITDATVQLVNDISKGSDLQTIISDQQSIQSAKDAVTENDLQTKATASRTQADLDYANAVKTFTDQRTAQEHQLSLALNQLETKIEAGTGSLTDLNNIMSTYGVTLDGQWQQLYNIDMPAAVSALSGKGGLIDATINLQGAFNDLVSWINKQYNLNIQTVTTSAATINSQALAQAVATASANPTDANIQAAYTAAQQAGYTQSLGYLRHAGIIPGFADGGIVTRPTLAMVGEGGQPEGIFPLSTLGNMGTEIHIHFDGTVIGTDLTKAARELEPHIRAAIIRSQRRNATSGIV